MPQENTGILIVFDGIDGAGKTTQVDLLSQALRNAGVTVVTSKEPTDGQWGQKIRQSATTERMPLDEELHAFIMDRKEHIETLVQPALDRGKIVILDRYYYSTICYQGARGEDKVKLRQDVMESALKPDISFIMDVNPHISQERIEVRDGAPNSFENIDYLTEVRKVYHWLCREDSSLYELDSNNTIDQLHTTIVNILVDGVLKDKLCAKDYGCDDEYHCSFRMTNTCQWSNLKSVLLKPLPKQTKFQALKYHTE
ncbi:dTMP kinase [Neptuniibacter marinus]|uniref:dTMP kinase n=1 Tax=Neptuniibacter marinus TaxID=1806670 RepID=UPI00082DD49A|nr:dTMP kinase [Neptuniibacter marinus]